MLGKLDAIVSAVGRWGFKYCVGSSRQAEQEAASPEPVKPNSLVAMPFDGCYCRRGSKGSLRNIAIVRWVSRFGAGKANRKVVVRRAGAIVLDCRLELVRGRFNNQQRSPTSEPVASPIGHVQGLLTLSRDKKATKGRLHR